ncbi:zinc finger protein 260-like [Dunckerocampus dactyliophorus]|uniref:zinc finger protein 260-like n=1 Tax=Dunckerocampus dactyliophorus TaxID=161453 RepID=UPI0024052661|nr:zinc finger protein 260-like [Dunckerocampus dactyliophorus]
MDHCYAKMATSSQREGGRESTPSTEKQPTGDNRERVEVSNNIFLEAILSPEKRVNEKSADLAEQVKQRPAMIVSLPKAAEFKSEDIERERQRKKPEELKKGTCKENNDLKEEIWRKSSTSAVLVAMFPQDERNRLLLIIDQARKAGKLPYINVQRTGDVQQLIGHQEGCPPQPQGTHFTSKQEEPQSSDIKEEEEELWITQDGECLLGPKELPLTGVSVKTEDHEDKPPESSQLHHSPSEENRRAEPPSSSSPQHMTTEADGDHCGGSQADNLLAPLSDSDDTTSHSPEDEDMDDTQEPLSCDADWEGEMRTHTDKRSKCSKKKTLPVTCSVCAKSFSRKYKLTQHMRIHTGEKPFSCSVCGKRFIRNAAMVSHMRRHTGEKPFSCSVCSESFSHRNSLTYHMLKHTGEKPFACSVCGQRFSQRSGLVLHMRIHTGEKPFACSVCGQRFSRNTTMVVHMKTHTGEKPFSCSVCGRRFCLNSALVSHMRIHTGERHVSCSICGQRFSRKSNMVAHLRTHTGEKPFSCSVCGKSYSHKISLTIHMRTHNSE